MIAMYIIISIAAAAMLVIWFMKVPMFLNVEKFFPWRCL
jgi:hypothetical protein